MKKKNDESQLQNIRVYENIICRFIHALLLLIWHIFYNLSIYIWLFYFITSRLLFLNALTKNRLPRRRYTIPSFFSHLLLRHWLRKLRFMCLHICNCLAIFCSFRRMMKTSLQNPVRVIFVVQCNLQHNSNNENLLFPGDTLEVLP